MQSSNVALDRGILERGILEALRPPFGSADSHAVKEARAYAQFAQTAQSCQAVPPLPAQIIAAEQALARTIGIVNKSCRDLEQTIRILGNAYAAFWVGVTFVGGSVGVVTVSSPTVAQNLIGSAWRSINALTSKGQALDYSDIARRRAVALLAFTKTILVSHPPPAPCAALIT